MQQPWRPQYSFIAQLLELCMTKVLSHDSTTVAALQTALYNGT